MFNWHCMHKGWKNSRRLGRLTKWSFFLMGVKLLVMFNKG